MAYVFTVYKKTFAMIFSCNIPNEYSSANTAALDKEKIRLIKSVNASYRCIMMAK